MTKRIGEPDTDADRQLRECLDLEPQTSFIMVAGAGSGKTTSLVKALDHLARTKGANLRRRGQQVACITYTDVAVKEIWEDVGNSPIFHVSTIHSFFWTVVRPFQPDILEWVNERIKEKVSLAEEKLANTKTKQNTRETLASDIERYKTQLASVGAVERFTYGTGSNYGKGILGHDDILKVCPALIASRPMLGKLIARRFPFVFVDESQDTTPDVVNALKQIATANPSVFSIGFFGDPMQKIYLAGAGSISPADGWRTITKPENFRCPQSVLRVINRIRAEDDGIQQVRGRITISDGQETPVEGTARIFIIKADEKRESRLASMRKWLAEQHDDQSWLREDGGDGVKMLVLVHRRAAFQLGFGELYSALNDNGDSRLKDGLQDGTAWVFKPFFDFLMPLAHAVESGAEFDVINALRKNCPLLSKERAQSQNLAGLLTRLRSDVGSLAGMMAEGSEKTIREVLNFVKEQDLVEMDERLVKLLAPDADQTKSGDDTPEEKAAKDFLGCRASQLWGYRTYIEDKSPFATQQGVKGAQFERVIVILDDEQDKYNLFSYDKLFGYAKLSKTDEDNIAANKESVLDRTRRLLYVCCSRSRRDLACEFRFNPATDSDLKPAGVPI